MAGWYATYWPAINTYFTLKTEVLNWFRQYLLGIIFSFIRVVEEIPNCSWTPPISPIVPHYNIYVSLKKKIQPVAILSKSHKLVIICIRIGHDHSWFVCVFRYFWFNHIICNYVLFISTRKKHTVNLVTITTIDKKLFTFKLVI